MGMSEVFWIFLMLSALQPILRQKLLAASRLVHGPLSPAHADPADGGVRPDALAARPGQRRAGLSS